MLEFRKSSRSGPWTDNCVLAGSESWQTSSYSTNGAQCVKVGFKNGEEIAVHVRDSKDPNGPCLHFTKDEWIAFVGDENGGVKGGEFDLV